MAELSDLSKEIQEFIQERSWRQFHTGKDMAISLSLEAAELLEHFQWKTDEEVVQHLKNHKEDVADEMADVLYWILVMSHDFGIDIVEAGLKKLEKTKQKYPVDKSKGNKLKYNKL